MDSSDVQEQLLRLYLRLNGFFTSGFIVHSAQSGKNKTEIDTVAVRFPNSREPERQIESDPWLDLSRENIELAICEVKTAKVRFNEAFYSDPEAIRSLLRWAGMFSEDDLDVVVSRVREVLVPEKNPKPLIRRTAPYGGIVVRALLFCPELKRPRSNQPWFVGGDDAIGFVFDCLSPASPKATCATNYGAVQWAELYGLVDFFKSWREQHPPTFLDVRKCFCGA